MTQSTLAILEDGDLRLRAPHKNDVNARYVLDNVPEIQHMFGVDLNACEPITQDSAQAWVNLQLATPNLWIIELEGRLIGSVFLHSIDMQDRRASLAMGILDPDLLGQGYGTRVLHMVLRHAFDVIGLHRISLRVLDYNIRAIAAYKKVGFVQEGLEREAALVGDTRYDDVMMGMLAADYKGQTA